VHGCTCNGRSIYLRRHRRRAVRKSMKLSVSRDSRTEIFLKKNDWGRWIRRQPVARMNTEDMVAGHYAKQRMDETTESWRLDKREGEKLHM
jgi:hypothetical protein